MHGRRTQRRTPKPPEKWPKTREERIRDWRNQLRREATYGAHYVNVYRLDRWYGGPEEGGWYYDSWDIVESIRKRTRGRAEKLAARLRRGQYPDPGNRGKSNYWNKQQDFRVSVEKTPGEDGSNYQPWC